MDDDDDDDDGDVDNDVYDDEDCDNLITIMMVPIIVCTPVCLPFLI